MSLQQYASVPHGFTITMDERDKCRIMWHVFIQWLTSKDLLVPWMDHIIDQSDSGRHYIFYGYQMCCIPWNAQRSRLTDISGHWKAYDFLNYQIVGPGHNLRGNYGDYIGKEMCYEWQKIRTDAVREMKWAKERGDT